jgi:hypothetical protein
MVVAVSALDVAELPSGAIATTVKEYVVSGVSPVNVVVVDVVGTTVVCPLGHVSVATKPVMLGAPLDELHEHVSVVLVVTHESGEGVVGVVAVV